MNWRRPLPPQPPPPLLALAAGTLLSGLSIALGAVVLSLLLTGDFLFEGELGDSGVEAVSPYFGAAALALLGSALLLVVEVGGWLGWRRWRDLAGPKRDAAAPGAGNRD